MNRPLQIGMIILALALPALSLTALGSLWLWQQGYMLHWALGACLVSLVIYGLGYLALKRSAGPARADKAGGRITGAAAAGVDGQDLFAAHPDPAVDESVPEEGGAEASMTSVWRGEEQRAWIEVERLAQTVELEGLTSRKAVLDLGRQTVETVARALHPDKKDPLLQFTVPEALALVERVSARLRPFVVQSIPLGDQVTVGQMMRLYNWRSVIGLASKAYDIWRLVRLVNPAAAVSHELRRRVSKEVYGWGREALMRKLAQRYVEEVGRAAIDLYAGRLKAIGDGAVNGPEHLRSDEALPARENKHSGSDGDRSGRKGRKGKTGSTAHPAKTPSALRRFGGQVAGGVGALKQLVWKKK